MDLLRKIQSKRHGKNSKETQLNTPLPPGTAAPDFALPSTTGDEFCLSEQLGSPIILAFYPADNSPVCSSQLALYNEAQSLFKEHNAKLFGISTDDINSHQDFAENLNLTFPLLSDSDPSGEIAKAFGVYDEQDESVQRALFVLDKSGNIHWSYVSPKNVNPGAHGILKALETL